MDEQIVDILKQKRPNLHGKSVKTYVSLIKTIMKNMDYETVEELNSNSKKLLNF